MKTHPVPNARAAASGDPPPMGEPGDELPVVNVDEGDDREHDDLRGEQQAEVSVQRSERRLDRVCDRRHGVGHDGERERREEQRARGQMRAQLAQASAHGDLLDGHGRPVPSADQASRHTVVRVRAGIVSAAPSRPRLDSAP
jgi:hypothetical protein